MTLSRRDFLKATSALGAALGLNAVLGVEEALGAEGGQSVVWLQAQGCSGCSVSLLNSIYYATADDLLVNTLDLNYHPTVMAAAGSRAVAAAMAAKGEKDYVLIVEGAVPTGADGKYCYLWSGLTALKGVRDFAENAALVIAVGTCSAYGGVVGGKPNPTRVRPLRHILNGKQIINIPGCPAHPDWIVGTIAYVLANGKAPKLDGLDRPEDYFGQPVHEQCPRKNMDKARALGESGCLNRIGCRGQHTRADCPTRKWNSGAGGEFGVNWCVQAGSPCQGCTEPQFPDSMSPFYQHLDEGQGAGPKAQERERIWREFLNEGRTPARRTSSSGRR